MRGVARSQEDLDASRRGMWCALLGALARDRLYALADGVRQACHSPLPPISRLRLRLRPPPPPPPPSLFAFLTTTTTIPPRRST